jgi:two-component system, chemotaxis family, sensor kinase CheA
MAHDDLTARLRATFLQELEEQVQELNRALLALEQRPGDAETIRTLFRSAHTIKGAAGVAGVPLVEQACHALEGVFAAVREGERRLEGSDFSLLFAVLDALAEAGRLLRAGDPLDTGSLAALVPRLDAVAPAREPPAAAAPQRPVPPPASRQQPPEVGAARADEPAPRPPHGAATATGVADRREAGDRTEAAEELVRVRADRLDALLAATGELIIATSRLVERGGPQDEDARRLQGVTGEVADIVRRLRLRPFADVCEGLPRAVRDIAAREGKQVELELDGQDVEADRMVVDALRDPLIHLVRNAVDHGIEDPAARERLGKPAAGRVRVAAELTAGRLLVTVADDGAGLDEDGIRRALESRGHGRPGSRAELADALLSGGFSTRPQATAISGRGVGMDVVRSAVEHIGGTVDVDWQRNRGTTFTITCPPSPATMRAVLVRLGTHTFAIPTAHVERLRRVSETDMHRTEGRTLITTEHGPLPVHSLAALLGPPLEARAIEGSATLVVVRVGARRAGLVVDEVLDEDEIVVRPLDVEDGALPYASGAAVLPSGRVALVLGGGALLAGGARAGTASAPSFAVPRDAPRIRVLVADDSITTRTLEQSVLEAAGYEVITAVDGEDAWRRLEEIGADIVIADVEMPRIDGFALSRRIRASQRFAELPVILVTALSSDEDRARGLEAGADAYIVKSSFDKSVLLDTIQQLAGAA